MLKKFYWWPIAYCCSHCDYQATWRDLRVSSHRPQGIGSPVVQVIPEDDGGDDYDDGDDYDGGDDDGDDGGSIVHVILDDR